MNYFLPSNNLVNFAKVLIGNVVPVFSALFCIPVLLAVLGSRDFGVLTMMWAIANYLFILDFGIGRALVFKLSTPRDYNMQLASVGLMVSLIIGVIFTGLSAAMLQTLTVFDLISEVNQRYAQHVVALIIPSVFVIVARGVLEGFSEFSYSSVNKALEGVLLFASPLALCTLWEPSLRAAVLGLVVARFVSAIHLALVLRRFIALTLVRFWKPCASLMSYGRGVFVSAVVGPSMIYGDRFVIAFLLGPAALPSYSIPQEVLQRLLVVSGAMGTAIMPALSALDSAQRRALYLRCMIFVGAIFLLMLLPVVLSVDLFFRSWLGDGFSEDMVPVAKIIMIGIFFNAIGQVSLAALYASNRPGYVAKAHIIELLLYVIFLPVVIIYFGILGAAVVWSARALLDFLILHLGYIFYGVHDGKPD